MSEYNHKRHNVTILMYHIVCPAKYRRVVISSDVDKVLKEVCFEIENRYELNFLEIGTEEDHVHFLVKSVPMYSPSKNSTDYKKYNSEANTCKMSRSENKTMGRRILDKGILCGNSK